MQYFTKELWSLTQEEDTVEDTDRLWQMALSAYSAQLESLSDRLPDEAFRFFRDEIIHDGRLDTATISEARPSPHRRGRTAGPDDPVTTRLCIRNCNEGKSWEILYRKVRRVLVDFPSSSPLFFSPGEGFHDIGYHELTDAGNGFLRHEILFSSGATILLEFREILVSQLAP